MLEIAKKYRSYNYLIVLSIDKIEVEVLNIGDELSQNCKRL